MNEVSPHTATHRHAARSQTRSNGTRIAAAHHTHQTQEPHTQHSEKHATTHTGHTHTHGWQSAYQTTMELSAPTPRGRQIGAHAHTHRATHTNTEASKTHAHTEQCHHGKDTEQHTTHTHNANSTHTNRGAQNPPSRYKNIASPTSGRWRKAQRCLLGLVTSVPSAQLVTSQEGSLSYLNFPTVTPIRHN